MRQSHNNHFAPRWVLLIYLISVMEAVGLSIYFRPWLTDAEMASMQPLYTETQQAGSELTAQQPTCDQCLLLAGSPHQDAIKRQ
jgi:hypothetical protein